MSKRNLNKNNKNNLNNKKLRVDLNLKWDKDEDIYSSESENEIENNKINEKNNKKNKKINEINESDDENISAEQKRKKFILILFLYFIY